MRATETHRPLSERFLDWLSHGSSGQPRELDLLGEHDVDRLAGQAGLTTAELRILVDRGVHSADELARMMAELGIDAAQIPPAVVRDLERVCSMCENKRECTHALDHGDAAATYREFCPNADTLAEERKV